MNDTNTLFQSNEATKPGFLVAEVSTCPSIQFFNVDCMDFMRSKPDKYYDLAVVDPPYGIDRLHTGGMPKKHGFKNWERKLWDKEKPTKEYWEELFRVSKNQIVWGGNYFTEHLPNSMGWVFWFKQKGMTFADGELAWTSFNKATRQYDLDGMGGGNRIHPTQKPIDLYRWLLQNYTQKGMKILDTHGGSMSSAIACDMEGYDLDICEIDLEYFTNGVKRFKEYKSQQRLF